MAKFVPDFGASGTGHTSGGVPDPGGSAGSTKFLREDATWATPAGTGLANPMTTAADLIVGGSSGTPARLAKGSDGQVLTVDPTTHLLVWGSPGAGSGGAISQIAQTIVAGSVAASVTFSSIPGTYTSLLLRITARGDAAGSNKVRAQINGDTAAHYGWQYAGAFGGGTGDGSDAFADSAWTIGNLTPSTGTAGFAASFDLVLPCYAATTFAQQFFCSSGFMSAASAGNLLPYHSAGVSTATPAAITSIKLFPPAGNFVIGSQFTLYGIV